MSDDRHLARGFGDFDGRVWLNTAHQGALPTCAADRAREAVDWKVSPSRLTQHRFEDVPRRLRRTLSRLLNASGDQIVLANSASYGLHLVANAYPWSAGDEIIVVDGDFPSDILPWLTLEDRFGAKVLRIRPKGRVVEPEDLLGAISPRTVVFCTTWVHSFSGAAVDVEALGQICRKRGVFFVLNGSQAVGSRVADVSRLPIDALTGVGFKWLCGPYGTGYCWLAPNLLDRLRRTQAYWLSMLSAADLASELGELSVGPVRTAADFDVFGTANFFNFTAFTAAIEHLLELGIERIERHNQELAQVAIEALARTRFRLLSPADATAQRSSLVLFGHDRPETLDEAADRLTAAGFDAARRAGAVRISPHLYNTAGQVSGALEVVASTDP